MKHICSKHTFAKVWQTPYHQSSCITSNLINPSQCAWFFHRYSWIVSWEIIENVKKQTMLKKVNLFFLDLPPDIWILTNFERVLSWPMPHLSTKFHCNLSSSFCVIHAAWWLTEYFCKISTVSVVWLVLLLHCFHTFTLPLFHKYTLWPNWLLFTKSYTGSSMYSLCTMGPFWGFQLHYFPMKQHLNVVASPYGAESNSYACVVHFVLCLAKHHITDTAGLFVNVCFWMLRFVTSQFFERVVHFIKLNLIR